MGWKRSKKRSFTQIYCLWAWLFHSSQKASEPNSVQFWPSSANIHKTWRQSFPMASKRTSSWELDERFCWYPHCGKICHMSSVPFQSQRAPHQTHTAAGNQMPPDLPPWCRHSPWQTKEEGVSPGWTRAVMNTTFCSAPGSRFAAAEKGRGQRGKKEK